LSVVGSVTPRIMSPQRAGLGEDSSGGFYVNILLLLLSSVWYGTGAKDERSHIMLAEDVFIRP
jgi:hypothetical protein